jgi:hypothetical protein
MSRVMTKKRMMLLTQRPCIPSSYKSLEITAFAFKRLEKGKVREEMIITVI